MNDKNRVTVIHLDVKQKDLIEKPLWFHKRGLQETRSGYGRKLRTQWMLKYNNRLHRVYCCIFSNSGTLYIRSKNEDLILNVD